MLAKIYAISANTFLETIRQPIYGVVLVVTLILMIMNVGIAGFTLEDDNKLLAELGLSTLLLSGMFLASFSATSVLTREIENKTVLTVISKPVNRVMFLVGKYVGMLAALTLAYYLSFLAFVFSLQHEVLQTSADPWHYPVLVFGMGGAIISCIIAGFWNFLTGKAFVTTALALGTPLLTAGVFFCGIFGREWALQPLTAGIPAPGYWLSAGLIYCAVVVLSAVALAASTRLGQVMTLLVCIGLLMIGLISDYLLGDLATRYWLIDMLYRHIPNFSLFWIVEAINGGYAIPGMYVVYTVIYGLMMTVAALMIGAFLFQRREVG